MSGGPIRFRLPHPFVLLLGVVGLAAALTWVLPAGSYQRRTDPATGREVVVAGPYARVAATLVGIGAAVMAVPRGITEAIGVILTVLFVGGAFALLDQTSALARLVGSLVGRTRRPRTVVVVISIVFAILGALEGMHEEIVALVPVLVVLSAGLGFGPVTALGMSVGAAVVGSSFGPTNPFLTGIALRFAGLPALTMPALRFGLFAAAVTVWITWTVVMTPLADLLSISRDAAVIAYQTGCTLTDGLTPTNGALLAMLLSARVDYGRWFRFAAPGTPLAAVVGAVGVLIAA